jgi:putative membrane protein insertion efficiency factor
MPPFNSDGQRSVLSQSDVRLALFALRFYKSYLSLLVGGSCRFEPTCSVYSYEAVERFGVARGAWLTLKRLLRCHPLSGTFGHDPVPEEQPDQQRSLIVQKEANP